MPNTANFYRFSFGRSFGRIVVPKHRPNHASVDHCYRVQTQGLQVQTLMCRLGDRGQRRFPGVRRAIRLSPSRREKFPGGQCWRAGGQREVSDRGQEKFATPPKGSSANASIPHVEGGFKTPPLACSPHNSPPSKMILIRRPHSEERNTIH